jgi:hypothetical protein
VRPAERLAARSQLLPLLKDHQQAVAPTTAITIAPTTPILNPREGG